MREWLKRVRNCSGRHSQNSSVSITRQRESLRIAIRGVVIILKTCLGIFSRGGKRRMRTLERIRQAIREQRYQISSHANSEMADNDLEAHNIEHILLTGQITQRFTNDPRGTRYEVSGETTDGR